MGALPGWMPVLIDRLTWGCSNSPWFIDLADEQKVLVRGRKIITDLWPFIRELPENISAVRACVPEGMTAGIQLLEKLRDSERHYQRLFLQQFDLAGVRVADVEALELSPYTRKLAAGMTSICTAGSYVDGIYAIVTAEMAASMLCRYSLPYYEQYFEKHAARYEPALIEGGLEWVRLHARTQVRHAIWMKRMLNEVEGEPGSSEIPQAALTILDAVLALWECSDESHQVAAGLKG